MLVEDVNVQLVCLVKFGSGIFSDKNIVGVFAAVMAEGKDPSMAGPIVGSLIVKLIAACLVAWLLFQTRLEYNKSVAFVTVVGFVLGFGAVMPYVIWFGFPGTFAISCIIESVFGWFFAGLAMAKMAGK